MKHLYAVRLQPKDGPTDLLLVQAENVLEAKQIALDALHSFDMDGVTIDELRVVADFGDQYSSVTVTGSVTGESTGPTYILED